MRLGLSLCVAMLMFNDPIASLARDARAALAEIAAWKGKYPYEKVGGRALYAHPELKKLLVETMGEDETKKLIFYNEHGPTVPVEVVDDFVILDACKRHDCGDEHFTVIVDVKEPRAFVCRSSDESQARGVVYWMTKGRPRVTAEGCGVEGDPGPAANRKLIDGIPKTLRERN